MPTTREELIAKAILDSQRRHNASNHTELANVLSSDAFSSMPLDSKAEVIKHYAGGAESEPELTSWEKAKALASGAVSGAIQKGGGTLLLGAIPFAMQQSMESKTPSQIASTVGKGMSRVAKPILLFTGGMGAWAKHQQLKEEKAVRGYTNELLERIRETSDQEGADRAAYELLASSAHTHATGENIRSKARKIGANSEQVSSRIYNQSLAAAGKEMEPVNPPPTTDAFKEAVLRKMRGQENS